MGEHPFPQAAEPSNDVSIENIQLTLPADAIGPSGVIAPGWKPWAAADDDFVPPTFGGVQQDNHVVQGFFSEQRFDAALFQQVRAPVGLHVTFTMKFLVRPTQHIDRERPPGLVVGVGIDPTGQTDPRGETVQWALRDLPHNHPVTSSVMVPARENTITVFVRTIAFIASSVTSASAGAASAQKCVTMKRPPYQRTYLLLPQGASPQMWERAARKAQQGQWTIGASADDAGIASGLLYPPLPQVVAVPSSRWGTNFGAQWFSDNFPPGVNFRWLQENEW